MPGCGLPTGQSLAEDNLGRRRRTAELGLLVSHRQMSQVQDCLAMAILRSSGLQGPKGVIGAGGGNVTGTRAQEKDSGP